jgi:hypothetical protein
VRSVPRTPHGVDLGVGEEIVLGGVHDPCEAGAGDPTAEVAGVDTTDCVGPRHPDPDRRLGHVA